MVFNSLHFAAFFVVVYALYRVLPHRAQNWLLLVSSYYFYAAWDWRFLGLLIGSTLVDYTCARAIARTADRGRRKRWLLVSLAFNLGALGFFKYFNFFADSFADLIGLVGMRASVTTLDIILPIGISFYTFMTISYVVDVYRRDIAPTDDLLDFAVFVAYFPHLVAGPILRAAKLIPQIAVPRRITAEQVTDGAWLVAWGLFQKIFVADNLAKVTEAIFAPGASPTGIDVLIGVYAFAFQIYGDFAGYSNIARGTSKLMGIELNVNFLFPYFVLTPSAFWRHWHISLSTWLRDYLYIPLGGNRGGSEWITRRNLMITMGLGGLWHGAAWNFVVWGLYQGLVLVVYRWAEGVAARFGRRLPTTVTPAALALGVLMFHVTCYGWLIFRARSFGQIVSMTASLVGDPTFGPETARHAWALAAYAAPLLVIHTFEAWRDDLLAIFRLPMPWRYAVYGAMLYLMVLFGDFGGSEFIYFQF